MEKLQSALSNARAKRGTATAAPTTGTTRFAGLQRSTTSDRAALRWQALQAFEPPRSTLIDHRVLTSVANDASTPFDILRTKILLQMQQNNWTRLAITSPMPECGKTTLACNLALSLGRQQGLRAMLLDFDLRDPRLNEFFDYRPEHSVSDMLEGKTDFAQHAVRIGENLAVAMSSRKIADPTRTLLAEQTAVTLNEIQKDYEPDLMIFDLPSVLVSDDTRAFLKHVDCALIVVRANKTRFNQFDRSEREIAEQTNVIGTVVNACRYGGSMPEMD